MTFNRKLITRIEKSKSENGSNWQLTSEIKLFPAETKQNKTGQRVRLIFSPSRCPGVVQQITGVTNILLMRGCCLGYRAWKIIVEKSEVAFFPFIPFLLFVYLRFLFFVDFVVVVAVCLFVCLFVVLFVYFVFVFFLLFFFLFFFSFVCLFFVLFCCLFFFVLFFFFGWGRLGKN